VPVYSLEASMVMDGPPFLCGRTYVFTEAMVRPPFQNINLPNSKPLTEDYYNGFCRSCLLDHSMSISNTPWRRSGRDTLPPIHWKGARKRTKTLYV
jgi:hypothetical protein